MRKQIKYHKPITGRAGKFLLKIFFALAILRLIFYISKSSTLKLSPSAMILFDILLVVIFILGIILNFPYKRILSSTKSFFEGTEVKGSDYYARIILAFLFKLALVSYLILLVSSKFREINFNIHYILFVSVILGIFSFIFPPKRENYKENQNKRKKGNNKSFVKE